MFRVGDRVQTTVLGKTGTIQEIKSERIVGVVFDGDKFPLSYFDRSLLQHEPLSWYELKDFLLEDEAPQLIYQNWEIYVGKGEDDAIEGILIISPNGEAYTANPSTASLGWHIKQAESFIDNQCVAVVS